MEDLDGNKIVVIHDIRFKRRQAIEWNDVEQYLRQYIGEAHIIERYNVFQAILLVRHAENNKLYLYDVMKIKKETSTHFQSEDLTQ